MASTVTESWSEAQQNSAAGIGEWMARREEVMCRLGKPQSTRILEG